MNSYLHPDSFIVTKEHRRFVEFCDACRKYCYIGLCYGPPGVGKTLSARTYANWDRFEVLNERFLDGQLPQDRKILNCRTILYTPPVVNSPRNVAQSISRMRMDLSTLVHTIKDFVESDGKIELSEILLNFSGPDITKLIIVDEADRMKTASLEQMRDIYDRQPIGLVLIGMPGIEKRLARYPQLYSRVGFVHHFKTLSHEEVRFILAHKWQQLNMTLDINDFTDTETLGTIIRVTGGNFRLLHRLFAQIERIIEINEVFTVTKEVVEAARELLIIGP